MLVQVAAWQPQNRFFAFLGGNLWDKVGFYVRGSIALHLAGAAGALSIFGPRAETCATHTQPTQSSSRCVHRQKRISPICTLSQNGYGASSSSKLWGASKSLLRNPGTAFWLSRGESL